MPVLIGILVYIAIIGLSAFGYIMNIENIVHHHAIIDFMLILRCVGIAVAPLGAVLGYF